MRGRQRIRIEIKNKSKLAFCAFLVGVWGGMKGRGMSWKMNWKPMVLAGAIPIAGFSLSGCEKAVLDRQVAELCEKDGGVKVYEAVMLPPEMFDRDGNPFPGRRSRPLEDRLGSDYQYVVETTHLKDGDPFQLFSEGRLSRRTEKIIRESDGKLMGQWVIYGRIGGEAILFGHPTSTICPEYRSADETLIRSVFLRRGE